MDDDLKKEEDQTPATLPTEDQKTLRDAGIEIVTRDNSIDKLEKTAEEKIIEQKATPKTTSYPSTNSDDDIRPLRTYKSDVEEAIQHNQLSAVKIAAAESDRNSRKNDKQDIPSHNARGLLFVAIGIVALAIALAVGSYIFLKSQSTMPVQGPSLPRSIVDVTSDETLPLISGKDAMSDFEQKMEMLKITGGSLTQIIPVSPNGIDIATSSDFFVALGTNVPEQLLQALDGTFTLGAYGAETNHPFLIFGIESFDNAFPGMLSWEKTITTDLQFFIRIDHPNFTPGDTAPVFSDKIILNKDIRELDDASGTPEILYSFINTNTLVITTNKDAMSRIITSLDNTNVVR